MLKNFLRFRFAMLAASHGAMVVMMSGCESAANYSVSDVSAELEENGIAVDPLSLPAGAEVALEKLPQTESTNPEVKNLTEQGYVIRALDGETSKPIAIVKPFAVSVLLDSLGGFDVGDVAILGYKTSVPDSKELVPFVLSNDQIKVKTLPDGRAVVEFVADASTVYFSPVAMKGDKSSAANSITYTDPYVSGGVVRAGAEILDSPEATASPSASPSPEVSQSPSTSPSTSSGGEDGDGSGSLPLEIPALADRQDLSLVATVAMAAVDLVNTGSAVVSCASIPDLPSGLSLSVSGGSCRISGTPSSAQGLTSYEISGLSGTGLSDSAFVRIAIVAPNPPSLSDASAQTYATEVAISDLSFVNSGASAISCSVSPALVSGLSLSNVANTCRISGTPLAMQSVTTHTVTATAADGSTDTATVSITVDDPNAPSAASSLSWSETSPHTSLSLTASWTKSSSSDVVSQKIQFYTGAACNSASGGPIDLSASAQTRSFTGTDGSTYTYKITSIDGANNPTDSSCSASIEINASAPASATSLVWSQSSPHSSTSVTAAWTKSVASDLSNQKIQFYTGAACNVVFGSLIDLVSASLQTRAFTGSNGTSYTYKLISIDTAGNQTESGCSSAMQIDTGAPNAAASLGWSQSSPHAGTSLTASWTKSDSSDLSNQSIQFYTGAACNTTSGSAIDLSSSSTQTRAFTGTNGQTYTYKIESIDFANNRTESSCSSALVVDTSAPSAPSALSWQQSSPYSGTSVTAAWTKSASSDLTNQKIQFYTGASCNTVSGTLIDLASSSAETRAFTGTDGNSYTYKIQSIDTAGNSSESSCSSSLSLDTSAPAAATSLVWSQSSPSSSLTVTASWTKSTDAGLNNQKIQFYSDASCTTASGSEIDLASSATQTRSFTGTDGSTYTYKITSSDSAGNEATSGCSSSMVIDLITLSKAISFDGSDDYVSVPDNAALKPTNKISFGSWVKIVGTGTQGPYSSVYFLTKGRQGYDPYLSYFSGYDTDTDKYYCEVSIDEVQYFAVSTSTFSNASDWHHVFCVYNNSTLKIYVNGSEQASTTVTGNINYSIDDNALRIGQWGFPGYARAYRGYLDDLRIYSSDISSTDVSNIYNSGNGSTSSVASGLVGWWKFDEGSGTTAANSGSASGIDGTFANGPTWVDGK